MKAAPIKAPGGASFIMDGEGGRVVARIASLQRKKKYSKK